jgi:hypothetical protein
MNTGAAQSVSGASDDILDGMFEVEEEHSKDGKGTGLEIKSYLAIDEKYKDLTPEEGLARTIQSREGKLVGQIHTLNEQNADLSKQARFLEELKENPELRTAFVGELDPELSQDVDSQVQNIMRKEFPDFEPKDEDKGDPLSQTSKYNRRVNRLYDKFENDSSKKSVKEILSDIDAKTKSKKEAFNANLAKIKEDNKYDDSTMDTFMGFAGKFNIFAIHKVFKFKYATAKPTKIGVKEGSSGFVSQDAQLKKIDEMFGKKKSGRSIKKE